MDVVELRPRSDELLAVQLLALQRAAYAVEAALIGDDRIPPLHEELADLRASDLCWLGVRADHGVTGAAAWCRQRTGVVLDRLVVAPAEHRRGVGAALVEAVLDRAAGLPVRVSTGRDNQPARRLYERLGFAPTGDEEVLPGLWVTHLAHGVRSAR